MKKSDWFDNWFNKHPIYRKLQKAAAKSAKEQESGDDFLPTNDVCPHCQRQNCILNNDGVYCQSCNVLITKMSKKVRQSYEELLSGAAQLRLAMKKRELDEWRAANLKSKK